MLFIYTRVSTAEQARDDRSSLQEQERVGRGVAMTKGLSGFDVSVCSDAGVSGAIPLRQRPAGAQLLASLKRGDTVVAAKLDRIFRSASDALVTIEQFQEMGVGLILADMSLDPVTGNGTGKLFFSMLVSFAEFERHRITERITDGKRAKKQKGGHLGGHAPYGFRRVGTGKVAALEPVEDEQKVIRSVLDLAKEHPPAEICRRLEADEVRNRAGQPFQICHVQRFIQREANGQPSGSH